MLALARDGVVAADRPERGARRLPRLPLRAHLARGGWKALLVAGAVVGLAWALRARPSRLRA